jgi:hypothetical protein
MAWWDDLIKTSNNILTSRNNTRTSTNNSNLTNFNPNININDVEQPNIDLSQSISGITDAGRGILNTDIQNFNTNIRPTNEYEEPLKQSISGLTDYARGQSQVDRNISNQLLQRFDASAATQNLAQAQRIASNPYLTQGAKNAAIMELQRTTGTQKANLVGQLAQQSQERAFTASQKLTDVLQNAAQFKEAEFMDTMNILSNDLNRELQAKIAAGNLTQSEAAMQLDKYKTDLNAVFNSKQLELDKLKSLDTYTLSSTELDLRKIDLQNTQIDMWQGIAANAILEMKNTNPNLTVEDVLNDPYAYQSLTNTYQTITGDDEPPSEVWVQSFINKIKTQNETEQENITTALNNISASLTNMGVDETTASNVSNWFKMYQETGCLIQVNEDGSISLLGIDGSPIKTIVEGTQTDVKPLSSGQLEDWVNENLGNDFLEQTISDINNGNITDVNELIEKTKSKLGSDYKSSFNNNLTKLFNDIQNNNIVSTQPQITFSEDIWGTKANKLLKSSDKKDQTNQQYIIDERVNEFLNDSSLNRVIKDEKVYNALKEESLEWKPEVKTEGQYVQFTNSFDIGSVINLDGKVYRVITEPTKTRDNYQHVYLYDFEVGKQVVLSSSSGKNKNGKTYLFVKN